MKKEKEYVVNVGNIGNITCDTRKEAEQVYQKYVAMSKSGKGRAGNEHVSLMIDGEPVKEHFADKEEMAKGKNINKSFKPKTLFKSSSYEDFKDFSEENDIEFVDWIDAEKGHELGRMKDGTFVETKLTFPSGNPLNVVYKIMTTDKTAEELRTGGVAGSKHVDVTRGKRLVHGYKAVKGSDKETNYSKGKPGVKVDKGWRLPHGYETTEASKNEKYNTGGNLEDKLKTDLAKKIYDNIYDFIDDANENTDSPGYGIVLANAPIFIQRQGQIEFWQDIDLIQSECDCYFEISDYNDLVIKTDQYQGEFRTGGVAGSKHVDVTRGRRLIHGYKAVKGSDKNFNYSKGHKGVKVTPGYRLPHGYETTEAAYNEKYDVGGTFLNSSDDISWLKENHLKDVKYPMFNSAMIYGNEDSPEKIELFESKQPLHTETPTTFILKDDYSGYEKYRTGGVAGSKHVDVVRGYRLVHGYKAVKGADKQENYSKGKAKVKVDKGWRLPHGYEVVEAYYNDKYSRGGLFGSSAVVKDINDEFASDELKSELKSKMKKDDVVIAFAYTDYGGDFFDKVLIEYFEENYPDNIVVENTGWSGQNAFVFGTPAEEFVEATENYPLGFEDTESYYYEKQYEEEQEGFARFIEDDLRDYDFDTEEVMQELNEKFGGYWNVLTTGLDYSYSTMIDHLKEKGLIKEKAAKGKNVTKETLLDKIKSAGAISENQVNLIKNRMNRGAIDSETQEVIDYVHNDEVKLTPEQNQKGIKFLRNLYKSPTGKVRTNNPFGEREISALDTFTHFLIVGFQNIGNSYRDNYVPVYAVIGKNGTFEYYYDGDVNVVGAKGMVMYSNGGGIGEMIDTSGNSGWVYANNGRPFDNLEEAKKYADNFNPNGVRYKAGHIDVIVVENNNVGGYNVVYREKNYVEPEKNLVKRVYRTGGVAGSKHVDVAKGYRLPHGYQAVKGSDKNFDYSKGYPKVKVDKGWRLPKGYEVVEGAYNMKYDTGGNFDMFLEENEENENWYNDNWFYEQYKNNKFMFQVDNEAGDFALEPTEMTIDEIEDYIVTSLQTGERAIYSAHNSIEKLANGGFSEHWGDGAYGGKRIIKASQIHAKVIDGIRSDVSDYTKQLPVGYSSSSSSNITESQYHRAVNHFVYFCMNYPLNFMDAFTGSMKNHLRSKFSSVYDKVGGEAAMITFYTELDSENQKALLSWAMNNYKGTKLAEGGIMDTEMLSSFDIMKKGKNVDTKGSYTILKANRAYCGVHDKTYSEAVETAKNHQCHNGLIVKGEMIWNNGRVKGIRLADGEEMMYGEYEREYFTEPQMKELKKLSKSK